MHSVNAESTKPLCGNVEKKGVEVRVVIGFMDGCVLHLTLTQKTGICIPSVYLNWQSSFI